MSSRITTNHSMSITIEFEQTSVIPIDNITDDQYYEIIQNHRQSMTRTINDTLFKISGIKIIEMPDIQREEVISKPNYIEQ